MTESDFKATMRDPMVEVTEEPGEVLDIWPYVASIASEVSLPAIVREKELVELVYRSGDGNFDHVLLPTEKKNKFVVIVVDRSNAAVAGHRIQDLNREYGLE